MDSIINLGMMFWQEILWGLGLLTFMSGVLWKLYSFPEVTKVTKREWERCRQKGIY